MSPDSQPTWQELIPRLRRDTEPPAVFITNPVTNVISQPVVELRGYSVEQTDGIGCDVSNAAGIQTNIPGFVNEQFVDPATLNISTNWFACSYLNFTNGSNFVTLRVRDRAGNVATNLYVYILDYASDTNAPVLSLQWPDDGGVVTGSRFTFRGIMDDPTATVMAEIVDTNGFTNSIKGLVEMNGLVWVEDLPLSVGTNILTLTMSDAAGNVSTTNLTVIGDNMNFAIDPVSQEQLTGAEAAITGKIDSTNFTVWLNGIKVTNYTSDGQGAWNWQVEQVPHGSGGTAVFQAVAIPNSDNGGNGSGGSGGGMGNPGSSSARVNESQTDEPPKWFIQKYEMGYDETFKWRSTNSLESADDHWWKNTYWTNALALPWPGPSSGGSGRDAYRFVVTDIVGTTSTNCDNKDYTWLRDYYPTSRPGIVIETNCCCAGTTTDTNGGGPNILMHVWNENGSYVRQFEGFPGTNTISQTERTITKLRTGGKKLSDKMNIHFVSAWAYEYTERDGDLQWKGSYVPATSIRILGTNLLEWDSTNVGKHYFLLPDNTEQDITPVVPVPRYAFGNSEYLKKYTLVNTCVANTPANKNRMEIGVAEDVALEFKGTLPIPFTPVWSTSAGGMSVPTGTLSVLTAPSNANPNVTVTAEVEGLKVERNFSVVPPSGYHHATISSKTGQFIPPGIAGAWMSLHVVIGPTNVCLDKVQFKEQTNSPSGVSGYFLTHTPLNHVSDTGADRWWSLAEDNSVIGDFDTAYYYGSSVLPGPSWTPGGHFTWVVPVIWKVGNGPTNSMNGWDQYFELDSNGTMRIRKFKQTVERTVGNSITPPL
jgi:hypothetical protein